MRKITTADFMRMSDIAIGDANKADALRGLLRDGKRRKAAEWSRAMVTAAPGELREIVNALAEALEEIGDAHQRRGKPAEITTTKALLAAVRAEKAKLREIKRAAAIYHGLVEAAGTLADHGATSLARAKARVLLKAAGLMPGRTFLTRARKHAADAVHINERELRSFLTK